ncbi:MAG: hypothetical protein AAGB04_27700 [Pseudomonadota bacterium]
MGHIENSQDIKAVDFGAADLKIQAQLDGDNVTINVMKSGACVHRLTIEDAVGRMEHSWIADLFARDDRVALSDLTKDAEDYISQLNINQG